MNDAVEIFCREDKTVVIFRINERPGDTGIDKKTFEDMVNNKVEVSFFMIRIEVGGTKSFNQYTFAEYNNRIPLNKRNLTCSCCGKIIDRDINASRNCYNYYVR